MEKYKHNKEYKKITKHIFKDKHFMTLKDIPHHGIKRLTHVVRVSYFSYIIAKKLKLDYKTAATAGLLHDFYFEVDPSKFIENMKFQYQHTIIAADNAKKYFNASEKEINIIKTHMFPITLPSKYLEGWIVSLVDKGVATYEYTLKLKNIIKMWFSSLRKSVK